MVVMFVFGSELLLICGCNVCICVSILSYLWWLCLYLSQFSFLFVVVMFVFVSVFFLICGENVCCCLSISSYLQFLMLVFVLVFFLICGGDGQSLWNVRLLQSPLDPLHYSTNSTHLQTSFMNL